MTISQTDLTGAARIREAALEVFAEYGDKGATIRRIAERANVSPALLQHHFGTKEQLRAACDEHVGGFLERQARAGVDEGQLDSEDFTAELFRASPAVLRYLTRALVDGSPGSSAIFDRIVDLTIPYVAAGTGTTPPADRATVLVALRLGLIVLHQHINRRLDVDLFTVGGGARVGAALLDLLNPELADAEVMATGRRAAERGLRGHPGGEPPAAEASAEAGAESGAESGHETGHQAGHESDHPDAPGQEPR